MFSDGPGTTRVSFVSWHPGSARLQIREHELHTGIMLGRSLTPTKCPAPCCACFSVHTLTQHASGDALTWAASDPISLLISLPSVSSGRSRMHAHVVERRRCLPRLSGNNCVFARGLCPKEKGVQKKEKDWSKRKKMRCQDVSK